MGISAPRDPLYKRAGWQKQTTKQTKTPKQTNKNRKREAPSAEGHTVELPVCDGVLVYLDSYV